jgi:hypothetical protein
MKKYAWLIILTVFVSVAWGAEVPTYEEYIVDTEVGYDPSSGIYKYDYTLSNPAGNKNLLLNISIYIPKDNSKKELSWDNLTYGKGYSRSSSEYNKDKVIAIGMEAPERWTYGIGYDEEGKGFVSFGILDEDEIKPGSSVSGLILTSYGIPTIRDFEAMPAYIATEEDAMSFAENEKEYASNTWEVLNRLYESITFSGKTVGPTAPPRELDPAGFIESLVDMKHEAYSLGWITDKGIEQSLDVKLDGALKKLRAGNVKAAGNILRAFINEVEAQGCETYEDCPKGKHLRPEAYALLKYNAQYLLDNLK